MQGNPQKGESALKKTIILSIIIAALIAAAAAVNFALSVSKDEVYVYYLNYKPEADAAWKKLAAVYTEETGIPVSIVTAASGEYKTTLMSELAKTQAPTLFQVTGPVDARNWIDFCYDLTGSDIESNLISTGILEAMWVWNDYLLPTLVLDIRKYRTIPMAIQYFRGSYGTVDLGAMMASIVIDIVPIIILYLVCQKYIIEGVVAGAVKG